MDSRFARKEESLVQYKERREGEVQQAYERKVVKKILLGLGVDRVLLGMEKVEADGDRSCLTFAWLYDKYPSFPIILTTRDTWVPSVVDFFRTRSHKNTFWPIWEEVTECLKGNKKPIGCIFPFPQVTDLGHGIVHNAEISFTGYNQEMEFVHMSRRRINGEVVILEQLDCFINRLRMDWEPT